MQIICYHKETAAIFGVGDCWDDAWIDARWNTGNSGINETAWRTAPADDDLIDAVHRWGGAVWWHVASGVAVLT